MLMQLKSTLNHVVGYVPLMGWTQWYRDYYRA